MFRMFLFRANQSKVKRRSFKKIEEVSANGIKINLEQN